MAISKETLGANARTWWSIKMAWCCWFDTFMLLFNKFLSWVTSASNKVHNHTHTNSMFHFESFFLCKVSMDFNSIHETQPFLSPHSFSLRYTFRHPDSFRNLVLGNPIIQWVCQVRSIQSIKASRKCLILFPHLSENIAMSNQQFPLCFTQYFFIPNSRHSWNQNGHAATTTGKATITSTFGEQKARIRWWLANGSDVILDMRCLPSRNYPREFAPMKRKIRHVFQKEAGSFSKHQFPGGHVMLVSGRGSLICAMLSDRQMSNKVGGWAPKIYSDILWPWFRFIKYGILSKLVGFLTKS